MRDRRMINRLIISDPRFNKLKTETKYLYLMLVLNAEDDGVVINPIDIAKLYKISKKNLKILSDLRYILQFSSGICVVKHWYSHNKIRANREKNSTYFEELSQLRVDERGFYTYKINTFEKDTKTYCQPQQNLMSAQDKIREDKIREDKISKDIYSQLETQKKTSLANASTISFVSNDKFIEFFSKTCPSLPKIQIMTTKRKKSLNDIVKQYGKDKLAKVLKKTEESDFLSGRNGKWGNCNIDWLLKPQNFVKVLEGNYDNERNKETEEQKLNKKYKEQYILNTQDNAKALKVKRAYEDVKKIRAKWETPKLEENK